MKKIIASVLLVVLVLVFSVGCKKKGDSIRGTFTYNLLENGGVELIADDQITNSNYVWIIDDTVTFDNMGGPYKQTFYFKKDGNHTVKLKVEAFSEGYRVNKESSQELMINSVPNTLKVNYMKLVSLKPEYQDKYYNFLFECGVNQDGKLPLPNFYDNFEYKTKPAYKNSSYLDLPLSFDLYNEDIKINFNIDDPLTYRNKLTISVKDSTDINYRYSGKSICGGSFNSLYQYNNGSANPYQSPVTIDNSNYKGILEVGVTWSKE